MLLAPRVQAGRAADGAGLALIRVGSQQACHAGAVHIQSVCQLAVHALVLVCDADEACGTTMPGWHAHHITAITCCAAHTTACALAPTTTHGASHHHLAWGVKNQHDPWQIPEPTRSAWRACADPTAKLRRLHVASEPTIPPTHLPGPCMPVWLHGATSHLHGRCGTPLPHHRCGTAACKTAKPSLDSLCCGAVPAVLASRAALTEH